MMLKKYIFFPYLISLFPILYLWSINNQYILPLMVIRSISFALLLAVVIHVTTKLLLRNWIKAGILTTLIIVLLFSYGHIYATIEYGELFGFSLGRHRYLVSAAILLIGLTAMVLARTKSAFTHTALNLNLLSFLLLIIPLSSIVSHAVQTQVLKVSRMDQGTSQSGLSTVSAELRGSLLGYNPDIYYIILDSYTREDILNKCFNYDNGEFVSALRQMGFYVADASRSNYTITDLSVASALNMNYVHDSNPESADSADMVIRTQWIQDSTVQRMLKQAGYTTIAVDSGYTSTEIKNADVYYGYDDSLRRVYLGGINTFESMLIKTSIGIFLFDIKDQLPNAFKMVFDSAYILHRNRILYSFERLENIPSYEQPTFTFVHVLAPHNPFVFGPKGEFVSRNTPFTLNDDQEVKSGIQYRRGYVDQVTYINKRMIEIVRKIQAESADPPVIIIQGDHGAPRWITSYTGRSDILNAYFIPGVETGLYPEISPVNSFRVIFNSVFSADLPLLPDRSYFSTHSTMDNQIPLAGDDLLCGSD